MNSMTRKVWFLLCAAILLVSNIVLLVMVFKPGQKPAERRFSPSSQLTRDLGLDEAQRRLFMARKDSFFKTMKPLWEDIRKSKYDLYQQLHDSTITDSAVRRLAVVIAEKTMIAEERQFHHFRELRTLCTPEQQVRFDTLVPQMMSRNNSRSRQRTTPTPR